MEKVNKVGPFYLTVRERSSHFTKQQSDGQAKKQAGSVVQMWDPDRLSQYESKWLK